MNKTIFPRETIPSHQGAGRVITCRRGFHGGVAAVLAGLLATACGTADLRAQQPRDDEDQGAQVQTRGPVHEAFAGVVSYNPEPGVRVTRESPAPIEELPPEERPEGDNVTWIPGYWGWDDERSDFLWVSGIWRALPPGREWIAGYWAEDSPGYQWTSGYWADASAGEACYLPAPPQSVESGPNIEAPSRDHGWRPGNWVWQQERYAWRPGYWAQGRTDWDWMPDHYVRTPRGYVYVDGYWDYPVARRGVLFAPVYLNRGVYSRPGYSYSPSVVIDLVSLVEHLFLRPSYHHYYFGDYYAPDYHRNGYWAAYSYQSGRAGYDPFFARQRWEHRQDRDWEGSFVRNYEYRRDHEGARPPRTWAAMRNLDANSAEAKQNRMVMAASLDQVAKRKDGPMRFQPVAKEDRQKLALRGREIQQSREQRRALEASAVAAAGDKPVTLKRPKSPIVAKRANQLERDQSPPEVPQAPKPDLKVRPKGEKAANQAAPGKGQPSADPRKAGPAKEPKPGRDKAVPAEKTRKPEKPGRVDKDRGKPGPTPERVEKKAPQEPKPRVKEGAGKAREPSAQPPERADKKAPQEPKPRVKEGAGKPREPSAQPPERAEKKAGKKDKEPK